jgi:creatinine amidohydrolase
MSPPDGQPRADEAFANLPDGQPRPGEAFAGPPDGPTGPGEASEGLALLRERCGKVIEDLLSYLDASSGPVLPGSTPLIATGIGGSEGPTRLLALLLQRRGAAARFVPLSSFATEAPPGRSLVVFSQGLSPNAALALTRRGRYEEALLVTGLAPGDEALPVGPGEALFLPGGEERGLLVRLRGPALAMAAAMRLAGAVAPEAARLREALERAAEHGRGLGPLPTGPLALLAAGEYAGACEGLRWRLLEGLLRPDVVLWDTLSVAHGPFQGFYEGAQTLVALEQGATAVLSERLGAMLRPGRHALLRLPSTLEEPWCLLEHLVQLDALMVATLERTPRRLCPWPGQGEDGPLYRLGQDC